MAKTIELTNENYKQIFENAEGISVVDFWAPWCGPCRKLEPVMEDLAEQFDGKVSVYKVNADENMDIAREYSVSGLPSVLIFKGKETVERMVGLMPKSLILKNINKYID